jgi:glycosyltransferase involved in cell wall biosynthesis
VVSAPLSVALLSHLASPEAPTGAERSLLLLARGLHARGHRVRVVLPGAWALDGELEAAGIERVTISTRACWLVYHEPRAAAVAALKWLRFAAPDPGRGALARWLEQTAPDVVHVNCLPHLGGAGVAHAAGLPVVWHLREILPPGRRSRWWAARLAGLADRVVAVSEAVAGWVRAEGLGARVEVVHNGVALPERPLDRAAARRELGLPQDDACTFGLFGQLLPHKGALELVRAARSALERSPRLRFVLAGPGPAGFVARLRDEIRSGPAADRFHLLPPRPSGEPLLAACDVACLTTTTPDPFPRAVLEAMAAGRPVAAFRSGGTAEMVEDGRTGLLADVGDLDALAAAFVRLGGDRDLRERLGAAGARRAREAFSVERHVERMEQVLRRAAS